MLIANMSPRTMAKTTDTGWLSHALTEDEEEYEVEGYDADHSKQFWSWSQREKGNFTFPVHLMASAQFHKEVVPAYGETIAMVDCGHSENHPYVADSVLRIADLVILHMSPTSGDWERIVEPEDATPFKDILARSAPLRATGRKPETWVPAQPHRGERVIDRLLPRGDDQGGVQRVLHGHPAQRALR